MGQRFLNKKQEIEVYGKEDPKFDGLKDGFKGDLKSHTIYFVKRIDKKIEKFTCKTKNPTMAYRYAGTELKKRIKEPQKKTKFRVLFSDAIDKYVKEKSKEVSPITMEGITNSFRYVKEYFSYDFIDQMEEKEWPEKWDEFQEWFKVKYPTYTFFNIFKNFRALSNYLLLNGDISKKPRLINRFAKKEKLAVKKKKDRIYTKEEIKLILSKAKNIGIEEYLICLMGYYLAFRAGDCLNLEWSRLGLDQDDPYVNFLGDDKASNFSKTPMPEKLRLALLEYKKTAPKSPWVFPMKTDLARPLYNQGFDFQAIKKAAGISYGTFHILRHTRLTNAFGDPKISDSHVMIMFRVSFEVAREHYIKPDKEHRRQFRSIAFLEDI